MPLISVYKCDECGSLKQESNHWFALFRTRWNGQTHDTEILSVVALEVYKSGTTGDVLTICGRECVQKVVERYMAESVK